MRIALKYYLLVALLSFVFKSYSQNIGDVEVVNAADLVCARRLGGPVKGTRPARASQAN